MSKHGILYRKFTQVFAKAYKEREEWKDIYVHNPCYVNRLTVINQGSIMYMESEPFPGSKA